MKLSIVYYGDPILRKKTPLLEEVNDELALLAQNMVETMDANNGIGLAAPQIGKSLRMFVLRNYITREDGRIELTEPQVFINPKITVLDDRVQEEDESCISIPRLAGSVTRPYHIRVEAMGLDGQPFTEEVEGYKARVIMHENDHLNGVLFIDRLSERERKKLEPHLKALKKKHGK